MIPLVVAADDAWLAMLGLRPQTEEATGDEYVRELHIPITEAQELHLTWDITDQSVRIRFHRDGNVIIDVYREGATLLTPEDQGTRCFVVAEFRTSDRIGHTRIQIRPFFAITDSLLRT